MSALAGATLERLLDELVECVAQRLLELQAAERGHRDSSSSPWMAIERAAVYVDLPKQRLYRLTASGDIPHYKQEGRLLFHRGELDAWLARFAEGQRSWMTDER